MQIEHPFSFALPSGLHARPASALAEFGRPFSSRITIAKAAGPGEADARSVLSVIGLDIKMGDACIIRADGPDAARVIAALPAFIAEHLSAHEPAPAPPSARDPLAAELPYVLRKHGPRFVAGIAACPGIGLGAAVILAGFDLSTFASGSAPASADAGAEIAATRSAIERVRADLASRAALARSAVEHDLLLAHRAIADDPALWSRIEQAASTGTTAPRAVAAAALEFCQRLRTCESASIRDRALDMQDVAAQIIAALGAAPPVRDITLPTDSVVLADTLTPSQFLRLDRHKLKGLVLGAVGATSHTVILARSLHIPTVVAVAAPAKFAAPGTQVVVDAHAGIALQADATVTRYYQGRRAVHAKRLARLGPQAREPARTRDGHTLEVGANASGPAEIEMAMAAGADGIGLFRTEWLFLDRDQPPTEDEQHAAYTAAITAAAGKPVIIRTFDIGGDKPAAYLNLPREDNPFLGRRGFRLYEPHATLLHTQLRAILRASAHGPVKIMAPMVSLPAEAAAFRTHVRKAQDELAREGVPFDAGIAVGLMIEVPAAAMAIDQLAPHADFFSIGTNDLCQYFFAADRGNPRVAPLCSPFHPSFLRLLRSIAESARAHDRWIGVCGDMASHTLALPLMLGVGVNEISVAPGDVSQRKQTVRSADAGRCRALLDAAAACHDEAAVLALLRSSPWRTPAALPLLSPALIDAAAGATTKEEAILAAIDLLHIDGRTDDPAAIERAVWAREATYSTGLGHGFAIPHCKVEHIAAPSMVVLRLKTPVDWASSDGQPVHTVVLLAMPAVDAAGTHMKVFAKLARKLMHESFRARLGAACDTPAILACLTEELELGTPAQ